MVPSIKIERELKDVSPQERYEKRLERSQPAGCFFSMAERTNATSTS